MAALPLVATHAALLAVFDLARWPLLTILLLGVAFVFYAHAGRRLEHLASGGAILLVAVVLRLLLLPLPPTLSDDTLRYAWDGKVVISGFNPYLLPPDAPELGPLRDEIWQRMPHREVPTVYPPLALALFSAGGGLPFPLLGVKILLCFAELIGCWLLSTLAGRLGLPPGRAVWYCWNPLVSVEVAGMGHVDALVVTAMVATVLLLVSNPARPLAAGAAAAAGVLSKLVPAVALPMWARQSRRPAAFLAVAGISIAVFLAPVALSVGGVPPGLVAYGVSWEFNGPLYEPLWRAFEHAELDDTVKHGFDQLKQWTDRHEFWNRFYPFVYPQLLAKLGLAVVFSGFFLASLRRRHPVLGSGRLFGALLVCSATFYPWYLLWVLPWAALCRHRAWLTLSALIQLSYLPQLVEGIDLFPWIFLMIWCPFWALLALGWRWRLD